MEAGPTETKKMSSWQKLGIGIATVLSALLSLVAIIALLLVLGVWWNEKNLASTLGLLGTLAVTGGLVWFTWYLNSFIRKPPGPPPETCQLCLRAVPTMKASMHRHIGMIILLHHKQVNGYLCKACLQQKFWEYTPGTAIVGWWGIASFFVTPIVLINNVVVYLRARRLSDFHDPTEAKLPPTS